jgi:hypothetical protein
LSTRLRTRNSSSGEWVPEYLVSMSFCGVALWLKLSESWPTFRFFDFHPMLKNERQKKILRPTKIHV